MIDSIKVNPRIWNDDPASVLTFSTDYMRTPPGGPESGGVWIEDTSLDADGGSGWANRHNWRFSDNGGTTNAVFMNNDAFEISADVTLTGTADIEGGLNISPWWSQDVDGVFMLRSGDGVIECWGGRLPIFNFTTQFGVTYAKGQTATLGMQYVPRSLTAADPGIIKYNLTYGGNDYTSGWLEFSEGNPGEDPPYGLWGILNDARAGGWFMPLIDNTDPNNWGRADFENVHYAPVPEPVSFALLALCGVGLAWRRR
jgi:hypothetical protein